MPRIVDATVTSVSRKPKEISSDLSSDAPVDTPYDVVRNANKHSVMVPMNHFTNKQLHNNKNNNFPLTHYQGARENVNSPSNLMMTYSSPCEPFQREEQAATNPEKAPLNPSKKPVFQKIKATMTLGNFLMMIGAMVVLAIPLAILTTLFIVNAPTTSTTSTTTPTTTGVNLATQCFTYSNIAYDFTRIYPYNAGSCSSTLDAYSGWYRFQSAVGIPKLLTVPFSGTCFCATTYGGWWNGTLPMTVGQTNIGNVCYASASSTCAYSSLALAVTNCSGYYVNFLLASSYGRYCITLT